MSADADSRAWDALDALYEAKGQGRAREQHTDLAKAIDAIREYIAGEDEAADDGPPQDVDEAHRILSAAGIAAGELSERVEDIIGERDDANALLRVARASDEAQRARIAELEALRAPASDAGAVEVRGVLSSVRGGGGIFLDCESPHTVPRALAYLVGQPVIVRVLPASGEPTPAGTDGEGR